MRRLITGTTMIAIVAATAASWVLLVEGAHWVLSN